ncbi:restriction endonuclease subunit S [Clostridium uliginosum]|uniref:Type I restriction enzyme, S subunit n=1 Tax=Clostridium uliginosum TaxID=119641 RepID=A0A1I1H8J1_9CLOT|nr:restriction endonuclease subunit S [Clostridium uliginosum]SFC20469.1 type I restriction enzyme, S subunit [Clostridium uliginosum]
MDKNKVNVPKIRFPGFTDSWEQRKLNEFIETSNEKNSDDVYNKDDVLSVSGNFGIVNQIEFQGRSFAGASVSNYGVVNTGSIVYTKSPLKRNPFGIIKTNKGKSGIVSTLYAVYKPKENTNPNFVQCYFELDYRLNNYLKPLVNKGAKNDMKVSDDNALLGLVIFPSYEEQTKISVFLETLDNLITLHQRKLEHLKDKKKGLFQKMFPKEGEIFPEVRFPGFTDPWEQRKVMDTAPLQRGFDLPKGEMKVGPYPVIMSNGINGYHSEYKVKGPGVITGRSGTIGNLHYTECNYWPHNTALWVTDFKCNYPRYIYYMYQRLNLNRFGTGSGVPTLNRNDVHSEVISLPNREEQIQIAEFFTNLDNLITLHKRKLEHLQQQKKGLLQQMFI